MSNHVLKLLSNEANKRPKSPKMMPWKLKWLKSAPMPKPQGLKKSKSARDMTQVAKRLATPYGFSQAKVQRGKDWLTHQTGRQVEVQCGRGEDINARLKAFEAKFYTKSPRKPKEVEHTSIPELTINSHWMNLHSKQPQSVIRVDPLLEEDPFDENFDVQVTQREVAVNNRAKQRVKEIRLVPRLNTYEKFGDKINIPAPIPSQQLQQFRATTVSKMRAPKNPFPMHLYPQRPKPNYDSENVLYSSRTFDRPRTQHRRVDSERLYFQSMDLSKQ